MAWFDDLNQGFPLGGQAQPGSIEALRATMAAQKPQEQPKKEKNFWTDQISTGGGIGGALGGAAAGAAIGSIVPGIGTVIGGLIGGIGGGALGSGAGEVAENAITGDDLMKNVGQEALLGGIFSAPPLRLAKGVIGAGKGLAQGAAKQGFEQAFTGAAKNATRTGVQRASQGALGEAWGIRPGVKSTGTLITPQKAAELQSFASKTIGVPKTSSADMVFERAVDYQRQTGDAIASAVSAIPANKVNIRELSRRLNTKFGGLIGTGGADNQVAKDIITKLSSARTPKELWELRKEIDNTLISFGRNPQSAVPGAEQVARAARNEISKALTDAAPGIKGLNRDYSNVVDVINLTADAARTPKGFKLPGFQQSVGGSTAQRIKAGAGSGIGMLPGGNPAAAGSVKSSTGGFVPTTIRQGIGQNIVPGQSPALDETLMQQSENQYLGSPGFGKPQEQASTSQLLGATTAPQPSAQSPYSQEQLLYDMQRDPQNADKYLSFYQSVQEAFPSGGAGADLTVSQMTRAAAAQNALQDIPLIEEAIGSGLLGGAKAIPGASTQVGRAILGTENLDAALFNIADNILRARSGAAAPEAEVRRFVDTFLPGPLDSEEAKVLKLQRAVRELQGYVNPQQAAQPGLEDALLQIQGGF